MRILGKLVLEKKISSLEKVCQYAGHVADIARLGQKKRWASVMWYDDKYREAQAGVDFAWGSRDMRDQRDLGLEDRTKPDKASAPDNDYSQSTTSKRGGRGRRGGGQRAHPTATEAVQFCRYYQQGTCRRSPCPDKHFCATCGSAEHGSKDHPASGK